MGKAEKGSAKYIANRIKAKGLQKLRWYCQMCQKQCRDENGFKCHTMSESHQRQLLLFADNASKYIDEFSREFQDGYLELLKRQFGTRRVNANKVYQDYIGHREHIHMNATQWETLTEFVKWLGREGKCVVDETEKGWFVTYIDRDPSAVAAAQARASKDKMDKDDQERMLEFIQKQVECDRSRAGAHAAADTKHYQEFKRESSQERVTLTLNVKRKPEDKKTEPLSSSALRASRGRDQPATKRQRLEEHTRQTALRDIITAEERARERANRKDHWLCEGIVVKIVGGPGDSAGLRGRKAAVERLDGKYSAAARLVDDRTTVTIAQDVVETVIPRVGRRVRLVNGAYRGTTGVLHTIHTDRYCCDVQITEGPLSGRLVAGVQYEDVCKLAA